MAHDIPFGNSNRENGTTFLDFLLFLGIFQWDEPTKRVPFTPEPEIPEILTKWKAPIVTCYRKIFYADFLCRRTRIYNYRAPRVLFVRARTLAVWDEFVWRGLQHGDPRWWKLVKMHHFSLKRRGIRAKWALWSENLLYFSSRQEFDAMCESFNNIKTETEAFSKRCHEIVSWILLTTTHSLEVA